jgi:hypothetical protein
MLLDVSYPSESRFVALTLPGVEVKVNRFFSYCFVLVTLRLVFRVLIF